MRSIWTRVWRVAGVIVLFSCNNVNGTRDTGRSIKDLHHDEDRPYFAHAHGQTAKEIRHTRPGLIRPWEPAIPAIIHQIFLDGEEEYERETMKPHATMKKEWQQSCIKYHPDYKYEFWNYTRAVDFLKTNYPWFLPTFEIYPKRVSQGDALRPFILYHIGGVYLDLDCECFKTMTPWLQPYSLVLQSEYGPGRDIINGMMASAPKHPYWEHVIELLRKNAKYLLMGQVTNKHVLGTTGPGITTHAFKELYDVEARPPDESWGGEWELNGMVTRVYELREWFVDCEWLEKECQRHTAEQVKSGQLPRELVGLHHYSGSWLSTVDFEAP